MNGHEHPSNLLPNPVLTKPRGPLRAEDLADLVRAMLTDAVFDVATARDPIELSRLAGLSLARVSSALAAGERRGLFQRHLAPSNSGPGTPKIVWQLSPSVTDLAMRFEDFAELSSHFSREVAEVASLRPPKDPTRNVAFNLEIAKTVFGKWSVDLLALIYSRKTVGFQEIVQPGCRVVDDHRIGEAITIPLREVGVGVAIDPVLADMPLQSALDGVRAGDIRHRRHEHVAEIVGAQLRRGGRRHRAAVDVDA